MRKWWTFEQDKMCIICWVAAVTVDWALFTYPIEKKKRIVHVTSRRNLRRSVPALHGTTPTRRTVNWGLEEHSNDCRQWWLNNASFHIRIVVYFGMQRNSADVISAPSHSWFWWTSAVGRPRHLPISQNVLAPFALQSCNLIIEIVKTWIICICDVDKVEVWIRIFKVLFSQTNDQKSVHIIQLWAATSLLL